MSDLDPPPAPPSSGLRPLPYHLEIADRLAAREPNLWRAFGEAASRSGGPAGPGPAPTSPGPAATDLGPPLTSVPVGDAGAATISPDAPDELQEALLRSAYRLDPASHAAVHAAAARAADALGVTVPVVIYQFEGSDGANAELIFRPAEAIVAFSGNTLGLLHGDELTAAFGHELAHHRLWSTDGGRMLTADRLLAALTMDARTPPVYYETARRYDLATELYADRGARLACGNLGAAIRSLVKVATGLAEVDDVAYLTQAEAANPRSGSRGMTHPETVLRAWVLARWEPDGDADETGDAAAVAAVANLLQPALDLDHLDLIDAERLAGVTRTLVMESLAAGEWMRTEPILGHARQFFPAEAGATGSTVRFPDGLAVTPIPAEASAETKRYLAYVLLDLATVDPDYDHAALVELMAVARLAGFGPTLEGVIRKELDIGDRVFAKLATDAATRERERAAATAPSP